MELAKHTLYSTRGPFARLKGALVAASEEKWATIPEIKDYDNSCWYAFYTMDPKSEMDFAVAFDDIIRCISELKAIDPEAFVTDSEFMDEVNAITQINPKNPIGCIAAVMIWEFAGNIKKAKELIQQGCEEFPNNELVWLEACRLESPVEAKAVIARALKAIPKSVKLWMQATELEVGNANKSKVLIEGLKKIPNSVSMWKAVVELADEEHATLLLQRAVPLCYGSAIRSAIPELERVARKIDKVGEIMELAIRSVHMQKGMKKIDTPAWIDVTEFVQQAAFVPIYQTIIPDTIASWENHLIMMALKGYDPRVSRLEQESKKDSKRKVHSMSNEDWNRGDDQRAARLEQESKKDSKRKLHSMSNEYWNSSPRDGDYPSWNKKRAKYFEPVPDTVQMFDLPTLGEARGSEVASTSDYLADLNLLDESDPSQLIQEGKRHSIFDDDWNSNPRVGDYSPLNKNRFMELTSKLDAIPIRGSAAVDQEVYLADLNLMDEIRSDIQINPKDLRGWIAAARKAKSAGMIHEARQLIKEALKMFPKNEYVWLEECRLANPDKAKCVIAKGLKMNPKSEKLWMQAAKLEPVNAKKIMVLTKGLDNIPGSLILKNAVEDLANEEDANIWSLGIKKRGGKTAA